MANFFCKLYDWTDEKLQDISMLFEITDNILVHFYNDKNCMMIYDFTEKHVKMYSLDDYDWAKQLDKQHEYGVVIHKINSNYTELNDLKIKFLRHCGICITNFNL